LRERERERERERNKIFSYQILKCVIKLQELIIVSEWHDSNTEIQRRVEQNKKSRNWSKYLHYLEYDNSDGLYHYENIQWTTLGKKRITHSKIKYILCELKFARDLEFPCNERLSNSDQFYCSEQSHNPEEGGKV
jgi:hypothetical protein